MRMCIHTLPCTTLQSSPTFLFAPPEAISQNIAHVQTHLTMHVCTGHLTAPPHLPHVDNTTPSETHSPRYAQDGASGAKGGKSGRMTGECSGETRASFHVLPTNTQSHRVYKSVPSCPLLFSQSPIHLPRSSNTYFHTNAGLFCHTNKPSLQSTRQGVVKERAGSWFGLSEPNLAAQPNKTFFKRWD